MKQFGLTVVALCLLAGRAPAAPAQDHAPKAAANSPAQVDGILSAVVDRLWAQTDVYWHQGDYPRIIALDRVITQADPHFLECYATGGWLIESLGQDMVNEKRPAEAQAYFRQAEAFYGQAVQNNPRASYAYYNLGLFYYNRVHDYPAAVRTFERDIHTPGADVNDWKMLAHSYERNGQLDKAVATWRQTAARWPNGAAVQVNLQRALALQQQRSRGDTASPAPPASGAAAPGTGG